jgi:hypothetical protein
MDQEKFEFKRSLLVFGNLALSFWILLGAIALWFYNQLAFWIFLLFAAFMVFAMLRRLGCSSCTYCTSCTSGFGRLSGWFFGRVPTKDLSSKTRLGFIGFLYFLLTLVPSVFLVISTIEVFTVAKIVVLAGILIISLYSIATWRMKK